MKTPDRKRFKTREEHPYKPAPLKGKLVLSSKEMRLNLGLTQTDFWAPVGVSQSGGSRYESGRNMPKPVRELLRLVHVEQIDVKAIKREDWEVVEYLKAQEPELFKSLKKSARSRSKKAA